MEKMQSIEDFYRHKLTWLPENLKSSIGHFNVFRLDDFTGRNARPVPYSRKDFYKISLIIGKSRVHYADRVIASDTQALLFSNPLVPYNWEPLDDDQTGFFCIFTDEFFNGHGNIREYPVFRPGQYPVFTLPEEQLVRVRQIYKEMFDEIASDYTYKYDVLRNKVSELIHLAMKLQPAATTLYSGSNASTRISSLFMELLERQFPIESPVQQINLRSPQAFADHLAVHVNHLNRALKDTIGKTTSQIISGRVTQEARSLLLHTDWNISEIGRCLGFEELPHFINFFKKNALVSPGTFRSTAA